MSSRFGKRNGNANGGEDFVRDVLARTSGSPCARAEMHLDALVDGDLAGLDRELVQAHLEHCSGCRALAVTLGWLGPVLPAMAEVDPGPEFTDRVLAATSRRRLPASAPALPQGPAGLMDRLGRWWEERILRPGFAAQVAYAATVVLVLLTATPLSPLRSMPRQAFELVTAGPATMPFVGTALDGASLWLATRADQARVAAGDQWREVVDDLDARRTRTSAEREQLALHLETMLDRASHRRLGEAGYELLGAWRSTRSAWHDWWQDENDNDGP